MDKCSYFIDNKALFGSFPSQAVINEFENIGVKYFVDLTSNIEEKLCPYKTKFTYISFPIPDRRIPVSWSSFAIFIVRLCDIISNLNVNEKIYIHCRGGHGRSGIVVASILCYLFKLSPEESLEKTRHYHGLRETMRDKWRRIGSPQTKSQKIFIQKFFSEFCIHGMQRKGCVYEFSNYAPIQVTIPDLGTFKYAEAAFQAFKNPLCKEYVSKQIASKTPAVSKTLGRCTDLRADWYEKRDQIMFKILIYKFNQHPYLKEKLLNTGFRSFIDKTNFDYYWGYVHGNGKNVFGNLLEKVRLHFYREYISLPI